MGPQGISWNCQDSDHCHGMDGRFGELGSDRNQIRHKSVHIRRRAYHPYVPYPLIVILGTTLPHVRHEGFQSDRTKPAPVNSRASDDRTRALSSGRGKLKVMIQIQYEYSSIIMIHAVAQTYQPPHGLHAGQSGSGSRPHTITDQWPIYEHDHTNIACHPS